jgi:hypothetical protein
MKWLTALALGALLAFLLPMILGGQEGGWMTSWTKWGTIRPLAGSPGLLFSIPLFVISALGFRMFFNWHSN